MIPSRLLADDVTQVRPAPVSSGYGDPSLDYRNPLLRRTIRANLGQTGGRDVTTGGRDAVVADWTMVTDELDVHPRDRVEWRGSVFEIIGPVQLATDHTVAALRTVAG